MKKRFGILFLLTLVLCMVRPMGATADEKMTKEDYINLGGYIEEEKMIEPYGSLATFNSDLNTATSYPSKYDTRNVIKIPAIRDQGRYGTCWAHATAACLEINMIKKGLANNSINLSELQLSYYAYYSMPDPLGNTKGESFSYSESSSCFLCRGGNSEMSMDAFFRGLQLTDEAASSSLAYTKCDAVHPGSTSASGLHPINKLSSSNATINPKVKIAGFTPIDVSNKKQIKKAIMEYGAVQASYSSNYECYTRDYTGIYNNNPYQTNHAITLIGWDDNYDRNKLLNYNGKKPSSNGAWIMRNSWGNYNSLGGYFYISYEDATLSSVCAYEAEKAVSKNNAYFYNNYDLMAMSPIMLRNYTTANVFTAKASGCSSEKLYGVGISVVSYTDTSVTCKIYTDLSNPKDPESGTLAATTSINVKGSAYLTKYYKKLSKAVTVKSGSNFSIVIEGSSDCMIILASKSKPGQSFIKYGSYCDLYNFYSNKSYNAEIYAFTQSATASTKTHTISYVLNGGKNSSKNPDKYTEGVGVASFANPTKSGYTFKGWYTDSAFKNKITSIGKSAASDYKLYAKWQKKVPYSKDYTVSGAKYEVNYSAKDEVTAVTLIKYSGSKTELTIDTVKINGKSLKVTAIGDNVFKGNKKLTKVTVGSSVKSIGKNAFYGCSKLKNMKIKTSKLATSNVKTNAFKGLNTSVKIEVPSDKLKDYKTLLKKRGVTGKKQKIVKY